MKCIAKTNSSSERYATNLRRDAKTKNLIWDSSRGQDVLIVQTVFGKRLDELLINALCTGIERIGKLTSAFIEVSPELFVCYISAAERVKNNGCPISAEARSYTVVGCELADNELTVYSPYDQAMLHSYVDIPMVLDVSIVMEKAKRGWFRRALAPTGFYSISFPRTMANNVADGSICIEVQGLEMPVTQEMVKQGKVYIETDEAPRVVSRNKGLRIVLNEGGYNDGV